VDWAVLETIGAIAVASIWPIDIAYGKIKELKKAQRIQMQVREIQKINPGDVLYWANTAIYPQFSFSQDAENNIGEILYSYQRYWRDKFIANEFDAWNKTFSELPDQDFFIASFFEYIDPVCSRTDPKWFHKRWSYYWRTKDNVEDIVLYDGDLSGDTPPNTACIDLYKLYLAFYRIAANKHLIQGYREPNIIKQIKSLEQSAVENVSD
jgi:hypothetical protein